MKVLPVQLEWLETGGGSVRESPGGTFRLIIPPTTRGYAVAQVDDYRKLPRRRFPWRPPLRLSLRARALHPHPIGTLGFGFWNDPFTFSLGQSGAARRIPAAPQALWFFYGSPPSDMALVPGVPGHGWKASSLDTPTIPSLLLAPIAAGAVALAQVPCLRHWVMRVALRAINADECLLDLDLREWHLYSITWLPEGASFEVDRETVLNVSTPPSGPLGFVAWIDNQYAVASPDGGFRFGILPTEKEQWLEIADLSLMAETSSGDDGDPAS